MNAITSSIFHACGRTLSLLGCVLAFQAGFSAGPYSPEDWPGSIDPSKVVHYVAADGSLAPPGESWIADELIILTGGDQVTMDYTIGGHTGKKATTVYLNLADRSWEFWKDEEFIDILVQVYGDGALFNAQGQPRDFEFLTGTLPPSELYAPSGGQIPLEARNKKWNWVLFRIPNTVRGSDGMRHVGSLPPNAQGGTQYGGVNGGTIRMQGVPNLIVRVVAFGQQGAFGEPADINLFFSSETCDPEPATNLAGIDFNRGATNHVQVMNNGDQTVSFADAIGPAGDKRRAVQPNGSYLNFAITDNYLGKPCNDPRAVKLGVEFYDDPAFAGLEVRFGPEEFATDDKGGTSAYPAEKRQVLAGSGQWIRRSWVVPAVNLKGINVDPLTGGPRLISENGQVWVSAFYIGILRIGTNALAGQDPLPDWFQDPAICTEAYGSYAELDLGQDIRNGLDVGSSGGDQEMIVEEAGPANDRRNAVRPARDDGSPGFSHQFLNFAITDEALGPSTQDPALLAICVAYYDDPLLAGKGFRPEVYQTEANGVDMLGFTTGDITVILQGTDTWKDAYWEIKDIKFNGVNQGPQAAARFVVEDKIFLTRVRYAVIRPCGPNAGKNPLEECKPIESVQLAYVLQPDKSLQLAWPSAATGFVLETSPSLSSPQWQTVAGSPEIIGEVFQMVVNPAQTAFYRLAKP